MFFQSNCQVSYGYLLHHLILSNTRSPIHPRLTLPASSSQSSTSNLIIVVMGPVVLDIGYNWNHPKIIEAGFDPHSIRLRIAGGPETMAMFGYEMDGFFVEPLGDIDAECNTYTPAIVSGWKSSFSRFHNSSGSDPDSCDGATTTNRATNRCIDITSEQYIASNIQRYIEKLKSRDYEAVVIGYSIRLGTDKAETILFEGLVNATREFAPRTKLAFNWNPASTLDALRRVAPVAL